MIFKSQNITSASGKLGGLVFTRGRSGMVMRALSIPTNPNTVAQAAARSQMTTISKLFSTVPAADMPAWIGYAASRYETNALGDRINLSAQMAFMKVNLILANAFMQPVLQAPPYLSFDNVVYPGPFEAGPSQLDDEADVTLQASAAFKTADYPGATMTFDISDFYTANNLTGKRRWRRLGKVAAQVGVPAEQTLTNPWGVPPAVGVKADVRISIILPNGSYLEAAGTETMTVGSGA